MEEAENNDRKRRAQEAPEGGLDGGDSLRGATRRDASSTQRVKESKPALRFCPKTKTLLRHRVDEERRILELFCPDCKYVEQPPRDQWCVLSSSATP